MSELKFKIGDEVLIKCVVKDTADNYPYADKDRPYRVSIAGGFGIWVSEDDLYSSRNKTLDDWKLAGEISRMLLIEIEDIFGDGWDIDRVFNMSPNDVRKKLDAYRNSKPKMGDVVECKYNHHNSVIPFKGILLGMDGEGFHWVLQPDENSPRKLHIDDWTITKIEDCKIDIVKALEEIK